jgi:hypothetical protein
VSEKVVERLLEPQGEREREERERESERIKRV